LPGQRRPCPLKQAGDRGRAGAQHLGRLVRPPAEDLAQDQGRPLAGRQLAEHGGQGEPHAVLRGGKLGRIGGACRGCRHLSCLQALSESAPPLPSAQQIQAGIGGDPVQPGSHAGAAIEARRGSPGPQHRLLDGVVRLGRTDYPLAVAGQLAPVRFQIADAHEGTDI